MDPISSLPTTTTPPSQNDLEVIKTLFGKGEAVSSAFRVKELIVPTLAFVALSLPFTDSLLKNNVTTNEFAVMAIKVLVFLLVLVILQLST
jgi:hypothetical protein